MKVDIEKYKAIKNYLKSFGDRLLQDGKPGHRKKTFNKWFETQDQIAYYPEFEKPKIVWNELGSMNSFTFDKIGFYTLDTAYIGIMNKVYMCILNSNIAFNFMKAISSVVSDQGLRFKKQYIEKVPIRLPDNAYFYENLADYLLFLNATEERREKFKDTIEFFDRQIADSLVYELYFKEKFAEDGLYPESKEYLLEAVSKHLKPINYDRWAELYWKKQIEGKLTDKDEEEFKRLEKENLETIQEVYDSMRQDKEINMWIEKIKSHDWVKTIER